MKKQAEAWLKIAAEDLDTAKYNFEGKRYLWGNIPMSTSP
ncbi:HEPN domain-containing protein [Moorella stamsii]|nr:MULTISPECIES: HEPN domain-containing protein [Moorella]